ncbi:MAG: hypothetical protein ABR577_18040 [Pyrinomonadaceae bacterium]
MTTTSFLVVRPLRSISRAFRVSFSARTPTLKFPLLLLLLVYVCITQFAHAQKSRSTSSAVRSPRLPAPEKIVNDYIKVAGGKKRLAAIKDATYEWSAVVQDQKITRATSQQKTPAAARTDLSYKAGGTSSASASPRSAWVRDADGLSRTLTDTEAGAAKLQAALAASRFLDFKKLNILARTVALEQTSSEPTYIVEFSTREGARLRYHFSAPSKLLLQITDDTRQTVTRFGDYRAENGTLEPHRIDIETKNQPPRLFTLHAARYNTNVSDAVFDPPSAEALDIPALLREVEQNQKKIDERVAEYSYTEKQTEREVNDRGEVTKTTVKVIEIVHLPGGGGFTRLISENGVPLSPERAAKQDKQIQEQVAKYEQEREKREQKKLEAEKSGKVKKKDDDDDLTVADFVRICEFVAPRRERLRDREAIVFDVRPRPGFRPSNRTESIVAKLNGVAWIDPVDKEVMRFEARFVEGIKVAGGLLASVRPGAAFVFEQARVADGLWLPRFAQANISLKVLLFKGIEINQTQEFSDYRRASTETKDYKLDAPKTDTAAPKKL